MPDKQVESDMRHWNIMIDKSRLFHVKRSAFMTACSVTTAGNGFGSEWNCNLVPCNIGIKIGINIGKVIG